MKMERGIKGSPVIPSHFQLVPAGLELWLRKPDRRLKCGFHCGGFSRDVLGSKSRLRDRSLHFEENPFSHDGSETPLNLLDFSTDGADKAARTFTLIIIFFLLYFSYRWCIQALRKMSFPTIDSYQNEGKYLQKCQ